MRSERVLSHVQRGVSKVSKYIHRHQNNDKSAHNGDVQDTNLVPTYDAVVSTNPSNNWDFTIVFKRGQNLPRADLLSSDPFLEAYLGPPEDSDSLSFVTGVQWATLNPTWDATWELLNVTEGMMLQILIKDKNKMMLDTELGRTSLILSAANIKEHVRDIWQSDNHKQGQVIVEITGKPSVGNSAALTKASTRGPARYSRHTSYAAGVLTREKRYEFYTYRVRLYHLYDVFGTDRNHYQHWNTEYDAAKRIFADSLEGLNIRNALHSQHSYLYRHGRTTSYGALTAAEDWGELLHGDRLSKVPCPDLKTVVFTYSIVPKGIYFSETGAAFFQDFMSKHAMHANHAPEVMYSGEFRLFRDENNNRWTLLIDNNSGTYAPKAEEIHKVQRVFELNFPDLVVIALDREDPHLKGICEATKQAEAEQAQHGEKMLLYRQESMQAHSPTEHACKC